MENCNITPVHKKDKKEYVEPAFADGASVIKVVYTYIHTYRPISLLCVVLKVFDSCVLNSIRDHIYEDMKVSQHGFTQRKSCVTNLVEVLNYFGQSWTLEAKLIRYILTCQRPSTK